MRTKIVKNLRLVFSCHANFLSILVTTSNIIFIHSNYMTQMVLRGHLESGISVKNLQISCGSCDKRSAVIIWDNRYAGYRGQCILCENNWPES